MILQFLIMSAVSVQFKPAPYSDTHFCLKNLFSNLGKNEKVIGIDFINKDLKTYLVAVSSKSRVFFVSVSGVVAVQGKKGKLSGQYLEPSAVASDTFGHIYVLDPPLKRVAHVMFKDGKLIPTDYVVDNFVKPSAVAVAENGFVYVADYGKKPIRIYDRYNALYYRIKGYQNAVGVAVLDKKMFWNKVKKNIVYILDNAGKRLVRASLRCRKIKSVALGFKASAVDVDGEGNAWVIDRQSNSIVVFSHKFKKLLSIHFPVKKFGRLKCISVVPWNKAVAVVSEEFWGAIRVEGVDRISSLSDVQVEVSEK